nr:glutaredoxin 3 [uncultured Sphingomonas sp.]
MAKVEIYLRNSCPYCVRAMRLLDMKKVALTVVDVESQPGKRAEMVQRAGGRTTVPQIFIGGQHIGGCDDLMDLEYDGKLDGLLAA